MDQFWNNAEAVIAVATAMLIAGIWIGKVQEHKTEVKKFMVEIRDKIDKIIERFPNKLLEGKSPLTLTEIGETISEEVGAKHWAREVAQRFVEQVRGKAPYEINDFAFAYVRDDFNPTAHAEAQIRTVAYEHGLAPDQVLDVLAVELRDRLLEIANASTSGSDETANPAHP